MVLEMKVGEASKRLSHSNISRISLGSLDEAPLGKVSDTSFSNSTLSKLLGIAGEKNICCVV